MNKVAIGYTLVGAGALIAGYNIAALRVANNKKVEPIILPKNEDTPMNRSTAEFQAQIVKEADKRQAKINISIGAGIALIGAVMVFRKEK